MFGATEASSRTVNALDQARPGGAAPSGYDVRASNALQWDMVEAAVADGRATWDERDLNALAGCGSQEG